MFSRKDLVAVVEVDDPEWEGTTFKKCLTGSQNWRDYLKMPENVKVSLRFVDPEPPVNTPNIPGFNFYEFLKKYRRKFADSPSTYPPDPDHIKVLNQRLSDLEIKLHDLTSHNSDSNSDICRSNKYYRPARPSLETKARPLTSVVYSLSTKGVKFTGDKPPEPKKPPEDDGSPWIYTNKRTQYSIPNIASLMTHRRYIDKSTSYMLVKPRSCIKKESKPDQTYKKSRPELEESRGERKVDSQPSQMSTLFRRISTFITPIKKVLLKKSDVEIDRDDICDRLRGSGAPEQTYGSSTNVEYIGQEAVYVDNGISEPASEIHCKCCRRKFPEVGAAKPSIIFRMKKVVKQVSQPEIVPSFSNSRSIPCPDIEDMSNTLKKQTADIEDLKKMIAQCLQRLEDTIGGCGTNRKERRKAMKLRKKQEKLRKKEAKRRKKEEKRRKNGEKLQALNDLCARHAAKKRKRTEEPEPLPVESTLNDEFCRCCRCGELKHLCKCGIIDSIVEIPPKAPPVPVKEKNLKCPCAPVQRKRGLFGLKF